MLLKLADIASKAFVVGKAISHSADIIIEITMGCAGRIHIIGTQAPREVQPSWYDWTRSLFGYPIPVLQPKPAASAGVVMPRKALVAGICVAAALTIGAIWYLGPRIEDDDSDCDSDG